MSSRMGTAEEWARMCREMPRMRGSDAQMFWYGLDEAALAFVAGVAGASPEALSEERLQWVVESRSERRRLPPALKDVTSMLLDAPELLPRYWRDRCHRTRAAAPGPSPGPEAADRTGLWPGEEVGLIEALRKPYAELTWVDCAVVCADGELFLPAELIAYFAPAIVEHAADLGLAGDYQVETLVAALAKALRAGGASIDAAALARAIAARRPQLSLERQWSGGGGWATVTGHGPGYAKALVLLAEVDVDDVHLEPLITSQRPNVAMTVIEHDRAVLDGGWLPARAAAARFYELSAIIARLERLASSPYPHVAAAAREVLGTG